MDDLQSCSLIVCHPGSDAAGNAQLRAVIAEKVVEPRIAQYASSIRGMLTVVALGFGVSFIAESQARFNPRRGVRYLSFEPCEAAFYASALYHGGGLRPKDRRLFEVVKAFIGQMDACDASAPH